MNFCPCTSKGLEILIYVTFYFQRHPKMDLNKNDLLRLLSYLEGELQARDISIAALKVKKKRLMFDFCKCDWMSMMRAFKSILVHVYLSGGRMPIMPWIVPHITSISLFVNYFRHSSFAVKFQYPLSKVVLRCLLKVLVW